MFISCFRGLGFRIFGVEGFRVEGRVPLLLPNSRNKGTLVKGATQEPFFFYYGLSRQPLTFWGLCSPAIIQDDNFFRSTLMLLDPRSEIPNLSSQSPTSNPPPEIP